MKYEIKTIKNYPNNGKHQECHIGLPFQIRKGEDGYHYKDKEGRKEYNLNPKKIDNRWIVHLMGTASQSLSSIFEIKCDRNLNKIISYCMDIYKESLRMEIERLKNTLPCQLINQHKNSSLTATAR